mgnify:CR=1 FL=1|jgi:hypothetical protein
METMLRPHLVKPLLIMVLPSADEDGSNGHLLPVFEV